MANNLPPGFQPFYFNQQIFSCRLASPSNLSGTLSPQNNVNGVGTTLTNSGALSALSIDGSLVLVGDRVLLPAQTLPSQNGVYIVSNPGSSVSPWVLTRSPDWCTLEQISTGQYVSIEDGSTLKGSIYVFVRPSPNQINVDPINFIQS